MRIRVFLYNPMMISRLGLVISAIFKRIAPDPFVLAILLTIVTFLIVLVYGEFAKDESRAAVLIDAWRGENGLGKLAFGMQMCLILVTGHALAATGPLRRVIDGLASLPRSTASAAALIGIVACLTALLNWGLGLIVGAMLARDVGRSLESRGIHAHYPLLCAAGYMGLLVWHGGLSGSAPLSVTTEIGAAKVLPADAVSASVVPLTDTIFSPLNIVVTGGLLLGVPVLLMLLAPRNSNDGVPIGAFPVPAELPSDEPRGTLLPDKLNRSPLIAWVLAGALLIAAVRFALDKGVSRLDLNTVIAIMLALGLILHASPLAYMAAATEGARGCAGIIIQFPLYFGIMAMMSEAELIHKIAHAFARYGNETTIPVMSFLSAGLVNLFVPSGGGQWSIQGPIALETGIAAGVAPGKMIMAVAYGDQLTNMLQPFWALPLLAITGVRARDIVGYTAIIMLVAAVWIGAMVMIF